MIGGGFGAGFAAPFGSLPLLLSLLAAGLWAETLAGRDTGRLPVATVAGLVAGAALLEFGLRLPYAGIAVPAAMVLLGVLAAAGARAPTAVALLVGVACGLWLGQVPAGPAGDSPSAWLGFACGSLTAAAAGIGFAAILAVLTAPVAPRIAGGAVALVGVLRLAGVI